MSHTYQFVEISRKLPGDDPFAPTVEEQCHQSDIHAIHYAKEQLKWEGCYRVILINESGHIILDDTGDFV
jgi:hypothetical protein